MEIDNNKPMPVLRVKPSDLPKAVMVVGDPDRAERIAGQLEESEELGRYREYVTFRGLHKGKPVAVASHGVGAGGSGICFEELCRAGAERLIRVGTAGGMQPTVQDGDHVIVTGAVREDGFTAGLVPLGFPAIPSRRVTAALVAGAAGRGAPFHEGVALTSAVMYPHEVLGSNLELWQRAGVMAVEQECSSLFVIASLHGVDAGSILTIDGNPLADDDTDMSGYDPHRLSVKEAVDAAAEVALEALTTDPEDGK